MYDKRTAAVFLAHFGIVAIVVVICCAAFPNAVSYHYSRIAYFILYVCLAFCTYRFSKQWFLDERIRSDHKAVLITGCDSGFGNQLARRLDSKGFYVFASCLFPDGPGVTELKQSSSDRLKTPYLDVTKDESVEKALQFVKDNLGSNELWAVVNNAGVFKGFNVDFTALDDYKDSMEVNAFGMVRVTKAFLPLLKKSKGRVVNINSLAGRTATLLMSAYSMSKYAAVAFTESLSKEMKVWGVDVVSVEPEFFYTPMVCEKNGIRTIDGVLSKASEDVTASYGDVYIQKMKNAALYVIRTASRNAHFVVDDIEAAVTHKYPDFSYTPRRNIFFRIVMHLLLNIPYEIEDKLTYFLAPIVIGYPGSQDIKGVTSSGK